MKYNVWREARPDNPQGYFGTLVRDAWRCACAEHGCLPGHWHATGTGFHVSTGPISLPMITASSRDEAMVMIGLRFAGRVAFGV